jgi:membrane associated rhomboid family serine protease/cytochrome c-type biogenesis protein CcmH/NrfG
MTICANCGREFEASSDSEPLCPQCMAEQLSPRPAEVVPSRLRQLSESPTIVLIALNVLIYLMMAFEGHSFLNFAPDLLLKWGANAGALTSGGQWWRLLTSTFEHGGLLHIALNMWCLYNLGWLAELLFGRSRFTLLYLMCGIGGSLGSICWHGNGVSVGASGAIFGIAGALIPAMLLHSNQQLRKLLKGQLTSIALFVVYNLAFGAAASGIDNAAHIGGLLTGMVLGVAFPTGSDRHERLGRMRVAAGMLFMVLIFTGAGVFASRRNEPYIEIEKAAKAHLRGDDNDAITHAQRAIALEPENAHAQFMLGTLLLNAHRYAEAEAPFETTMRLRPKFGPAYVNLCVAQRELKQFDAALANCEQGAQLAPTEPESWFNLGRVRYELHNISGARDALAKAVSLNPEGFDENLQYALMLISNGETAKAVPYLHKAHDLHPQDADVTKLLGQAQAQ